MRLLITGSNGQLGTDLCKVFRGLDLVPLTHADLDVTDSESVNEILDDFRPDVVINTAAYVRVDDCEVNRDQAFQVNAEGAQNIALAAEKIGAKLIHISTDYVFGGEGPRSSPYSELAVPIPLNIYGNSKLAGERYVRSLCSKHIIVRTSGLFGTAGSSGKGGNFIETILRMGKERGELNVVNDQVFSPSYTVDVAEKIAELIETDNYGIFHITNSGECSWFAFAREILRLSNVKAHLNPVTSIQYRQKAKRPAYSVLRHLHLARLGMDNMRPWENALTVYLRKKGHLIKEQAFV